MWSIIAGIFAALIGFGTGAAGLGNILPGQTQPVTPYSSNACYNPEPDVKITLKWPDNFTNLSDNRVTLNPSVFGSKPIKFNAQDSCRPTLMNNTTGQEVNPRTYIRVRQNVRLSSCKTDELAGLYNGGKCPEGSIGTALIMRGSCDASGYPDLRKVAEVKQEDKILEIFWVPFSHNVGCDYEGRNNCGPGDRTNLNLREFIYVLNSRDAFDKDNPKNCKPLWEAGSKNQSACSHYFDVYMAEDLFNKLNNLSDVAKNDPYYDTYHFYQKALLNCQEQSTFSPIVDLPNLTFPPYYIQLPFVASENEFYSTKQNKIVPQQAPVEGDNYKYFILSSPAINPFTTNLLQITDSETTITPCKPGDSLMSINTTQSCFAPLGVIIFQKPNTNSYVRFAVYTRYDTPQTFYFSDQSEEDDQVYSYTITDETPPQNLFHAPALQLTALQFTSGNEWTWATPSCKPAIYLYPEKPTNLNVKLDIVGQLTTSNPVYNADNGWNIIAYPDGTIQNSASLKDTSGKETKNNYPYLYYEANLYGVTLPKEGWVVSQEELSRQLTEILRQIGFNTKETTDFLSYWLPRLKDKAYYFVTLLPEKVINEKEKLVFSISPDTLIRTRVIFEGLDAPLTVTPLTNIPHYLRQGFVVTDWGGALVGKSCTEVIVQ